MPKRLISEKEIRQIAKSGVKSITVDENTIVTPTAREIATRFGIAFLLGKSGSSVSGSESSRIGATDTRRSPGANPASSTVVAMGSDHGGYKLKETLKTYVAALGYKIVDVGTDSEETCDYPDFAYAAARLISTGEAWRGIVIDGAGSGSCMVANKLPGVRAASCTNEFLARSSREHNDANVLTLGSRVVGTELAKSIVKVWLESVFSGGRHRKRVDKIGDVEERILK